MAESNPEMEIPEMEILAAQALAADHAPSISLHREIAFDRGPTQNTPLELQGKPWTSGLPPWHAYKVESLGPKPVFFIMETPPSPVMASHEPSDGDSKPVLGI